MPSPKIKTPASDRILERLTALHPKSIDLSLGRLLRLLDRLGNPHLRLPPVVHVAGTNGKGSLIAYLRAMLQAAGCSVHVYTSPHLIRFAERIELAGRMIEEDRLADLLARVEAVNGDDPITFFEITTAAAFVAFSEQPADVVLLETGLGGRLDATNVVDRPRLCAIMPVSLDHMHYLGDTLAAIAGEKAGILKPGVACVVSRQPAIAGHVIAERARAVGAPLLRQGHEWDAESDGAHFYWRQGAEALRLPMPALAGAHQRDNAAVAVACARQLGVPALNAEAIAAGLARVAWPGRLQRIDAGPLVSAAPAGAEVWLDGGHNPAAGEALSAAMTALGREVGGARPLYLVVGMLNSKDPAGFLAPFADIAEMVIGVEIPGESATLTGTAIAAAAREAGLEATTSPSLLVAMERIREQVGGNALPRILIAGSLYLAGTVLAELA